MIYTCAFLHTPSYFSLLWCGFTVSVLCFANCGLSQPFLFFGYKLTEGLVCSI